MPACTRIHEIGGYELTEYAANLLTQMERNLVDLLQYDYMEIVGDIREKCYHIPNNFVG